MARENDQISLFDEEIENEWQKEWKGMPEFSQEDQTSWKSVIIHFESREDMDQLSELIGQKLTFRTRSIWFPKAEIGRYANKVFIKKD
jgi:hypothetical protein